MPIDLTEASSEYRTNAGAAAPKMARRYIAATGKLDKARSPAAQKAYEEAMRDPAVLARRAKNLGKLSEADLNKAMEEKGASNYGTGVAAGADKWQRNFTPYAGEIDRLKGTLPARSRDPMANLTNRAGHFVKGLSELKKKQG